MKESFLHKLEVNLVQPHFFPYLFRTNVNGGKKGLALRARSSNGQFQCCDLLGPTSHNNKSHRPPPHAHLIHDFISVFNTPTLLLSIPWCVC